MEKEHDRFPTDGLSDTDEELDDTVLLEEGAPETPTTSSSDCAGNLDGKVSDVSILTTQDYDTDKFVTQHTNNESDSSSDSEVDVNDKQQKHTSMVDVHASRLALARPQADEASEKHSKEDAEPELRLRSRAVRRTLDRDDRELAAKEVEVKLPADVKNKGRCTSILGAASVEPLATGSSTSKRVTIVEPIDTPATTSCKTTRRTETPVTAIRTGTTVKTTDAEMHDKTRARETVTRGAASSTIPRRELPAAKPPINRAQEWRAHELRRYAAGELSRADEQKLMLSILNEASLSPEDREHLINYENIVSYGVIYPEESAESFEVRILDSETNKLKFILQDCTEQEQAALLQWKLSNISEDIQNQAAAGTLPAAAETSARRTMGYQPPQVQVPAAPVTTVTQDRYGLSSNYTELLKAYELKQQQDKQLLAKATRELEEIIIAKSTTENESGESAVRSTAAPAMTSTPDVTPSTPSLEELTRILELTNTRNYHRDNVQPVPPAPTARHYISKPTNFTGENWESYKLHFESCKEANHWNDVEATQILQAHLTGDAIYIITQKPAAGWTYEELIDALDVRYDQGGPDYVIQSRLRNVKQGFKGTLQAFADSCLKAVWNKLADPKKESEWALEQFKFGLRDPKMQRHLHKKKPRSIQEALSITKEYEESRSFLEKEQPNVRVTTAGVQQTDKVKQLQDDISRLKRQLHQSGAPPAHAPGDVRTPTYQGPPRDNRNYGTARGQGMHRGFRNRFGPQRIHDRAPNRGGHQSGAPQGHQQN